jgi:hypothetical protein
LTLELQQSTCHLRNCQQAFAGVLLSSQQRKLFITFEVTVACGFESALESGTLRALLFAILVAINACSEPIMVQGAGR